MSDELYCQDCRRSLDERQLHMKSLTIESCPFCETVVRQSEGMRATNLDAIIMEDIAAIDGWLEAHQNATGAQITKHPPDKGKYEWLVTTTSAFGCELAYSSDRTGIVELRLVSSDHGDAICGQPHRLQKICAMKGLQPFGVRTTDALSNAVVCKWGAVRFLSTSTLCEELFEPLIATLEEVATTALKEFSGE